jgi:hypothetical protein
MSTDASAHVLEPDQVSRFGFKSDGPVSLTNWSGRITNGKQRTPASRIPHNKVDLAQVSLKNFLLPETIGVYNSKL